ncbi:MAG TPA: carbon-nitrogen hydrolase family protein [Polyangiaceae bacterium]|jgi:predicted amidohydrolase
MPVPSFRLALASLPYPESREHSVALASQAIADASAAGARLVAFPECYVPGYRAPGRPVLPPDPAFLEAAWSSLGAACARHRITAVVGTERMVDGALHIAALVLGEDGAVLGFQDKVQMALEEDGVYVAARGRHVFQCGELRFGVAICHEGFRYPETVRGNVPSAGEIGWRRSCDYAALFEPSMDLVSSGVSQARRAATSFGIP